MINPRPVLFLMLLWISVLVLLQGCALIPTATTTATTAGGSYQTYKTITIAKTGIDTALTLNGEKTTTDHILSSVTGKDCKMMRMVEQENITFFCVDTIPEHLTNRNK